jgi:hypothetical protein
MTPQAALNAQIEKYRAMTGEERLKAGALRERIALAQSL